MASSYKPSGLSFNSPRTSPFRRPSSPGSPSTVVGRPLTPPGKTGPSPMASPSKLKQSFTMSEQDNDEDDEPSMRPQPLRSKTEPPASARSQTEPPPSPTTRGLSSPSKTDINSFSISAAARSPGNFAASQPPQTDVLSKLPPQLLHSMRESFSVLDSNSTGTVNAASVVETLQSLGLADSNTSQYFPFGQPQQLSLPQYLNQLANILVDLSPQQEILNALAAFDDDDSGQIDIAELRDALLHTAPEPGERPLTERDIDTALEGFTGRRILGKHAVGIAGVKGLDGRPSKKNGEVFRYQEWVGNMTGGSNGGVDQAAPPGVPAR